MHVVYDFTQKYQNACKVGRIVRMAKELTWDDFLAAFPENEKQFWRCNTCKEWFKEFGSLVVLNEEALEPVFWVADENTPADLVPVFEHLRALVKQYVAEEGGLVPYHAGRAYLRKANTTGIVGLAEKGGFSHFHFAEGQFKLSRSGANQVNALYENVRQRLVRTVKHPHVVERIEQVCGHLEMSPYAKAKKDAETVRNWFLDPIKRIKAGEGLSKVLLSLGDDQIGYLNSFANSAVSSPVLGFACDGLNLDLECDKYFEMIDPENFRKTKREAGEAAVKGLVEKIRTEGTDAALTVRFAKLDELRLDVTFPVAAKAGVEETAEAPAEERRSLLAAAEELLDEKKEKEVASQFWDLAPGQKEFDGTGERIGLKAFLELAKKHNSPVNVYIPPVFPAGAWITHDEASEENYPWRWNIKADPAPFSWITQVNPHLFGINSGWASVAGIVNPGYDGKHELRTEFDEGRLMLVLVGDQYGEHPLEINFKSASPYLTEYLNKDYYEHRRALNDLGARTPMVYGGEPFSVALNPNGSAVLARIKANGRVYFYEVVYADTFDLGAVNGEA